MKKKNLFLALTLGVISLSGCSGEPSTSVSTTMPEFKRYNSIKEYNFVLDYNVDVTHGRDYASGWNERYQYDGSTIQITYESGNAFYTDYYYENEAENEYKYYIDVGNATNYQYLDGGKEDNTLFWSFYSNIEFIDISDINFEDNFDVENDKLIAKENKIQEMGEKIFGANVGEYWDKLNLTIKDKYVSEINAVSIYEEYVYYYSIKMYNHTWVNLEDEITNIRENALKEYVGNVPHFSNEVYSGVALTPEQKAAIECFDDESKVNYSVKTKWTFSINMELAPDYGEYSFKEVYDGMKCSFTYDDASTGFTYTDYYTTTESSWVYYSDLGNGSYRPYTSGGNDLPSIANYMLLDLLNLAELDGDDFIYNADKGYIMPKDKDTERELTNKMFGGYNVDCMYGLHIYLTDNVISKVETSYFYQQSKDAVASYYKIYEVSNVGTSTVTLPESIQD